VTGKQTLRAVVEAWNSHDVERILRLFHEDYENDQAPLPPMRGLAAYREHLERWFAAYPDLRVEILTLVAEGDTVCMEARLETVATGRGFFGEAPRGRRENRAMDVFVLREGKVWRQRGYWDFSLYTGRVAPVLDAASSVSLD
jgi:predicted ester cyclase